MSSRRGDGWSWWWARPACSCRALVTSGKWLNAWGVLPSCRPVWGSHSSLSSPTSLRRASSRSNSWVASVCWPARCSASTSQKEQARNRPRPAIAAASSHRSVSTDQDPARPDADPGRPSPRSEVGHIPVFHGWVQTVSGVFTSLGVVATLCVLIVEQRRYRADQRRARSDQTRLVLPPGRLSSYPDRPPYGDSASQSAHRIAEETAALYHPHIVGVHDRGEWTVSSGSRWTSSTVDAAPAADRYPAGMPVVEVVTIVTAWRARGLRAQTGPAAPRRQARQHHAHPRRDDGEQRILLADFGIARNIDESADSRRRNDRGDCRLLPHPSN